MYKMPTVAVAVPCFNGQNYIRSNLESIRRQVYQPNEVIVVDDGSQDQSKRIVQDYYPRVKLISHPENRGIAVARNTAWINSRSDIITFVDADTILSPNLLKEILHCYDSDEIAGVGGQGIDLFEKNQADKWRKEVLFQHWGEVFKANVPFLFGICSSYRRSVLEKLGGFDCLFKSSGEDLDFGYRVQKVNLRLVYQPEAKVVHLRQDDYNSIKRMTYRHCYWGFLAQMKNRCFKNKISLSKNCAIFVRLAILDGLLKGKITNACRVVFLCGLILRAWIEAKHHHGLFLKGKAFPETKGSWESPKDLELPEFELDKLLKKEMQKMWLTVD